VQIQLSKLEIRSNSPIGSKWLSIKRRK